MPPTPGVKKSPRSRSKTVKLNLGCGQRQIEGFQGVDIAPGEGVDHVVDLFQYPWPFAERSVSEVICSHLIEHIPHYRPEYEGVDGFWMFFNELHRIMRKGAIATFHCPYFKGDRAFWDPSHTRYIHEMNFSYLSPAWMEANGLQHYPITANFEIVTIEGTGIPEKIMNRNAEYQAEARDYYWNYMTDLVVKLKAIK